MQRYKFDLTFLKRFLQLCRLMFPSWGHVAVLLCFFLLCVSLLEQVVIYNIGLIPSQYFKVLGDKDQAGFTTHTFKAVGLILAEALLSSTMLYVGSCLYLTWRGSITLALHRRYFRDFLYYQLNVVDKDIDNPDQRITQDVDRLCLWFSQVFAPLIISPFTIAYYTQQAASSTGYIGPVSVLVFFIVMTIINKFLMSPVVHAMYKQEAKEGDFRFKHMLIRSNSESLAFYHSGQLEERKTNAKLQTLLKTQKTLILKEYFLNIAIKFADYMGSILSYIALAVPIFAGAYGTLSPSDLSALISKNAFVTIYLVNCFTKLIDLSEKVADMAGCAHRLGQLLETLGRLSDRQDQRCLPPHSLTHGDTDECCKPLLAPSHGVGTDNSCHLVANREDNSQQHLQLSDIPQTRSARVMDRSSPRKALKLEDVSYSPPQRPDILCKNLSFELEAGVSVLITGASGCGKTSLLRVIKGLWSQRTGKVVSLINHHPHKILFLPQKPFFTDGSLREQIIYPLEESEVVPDDDKIHKLLKLVGLTTLLDRNGGLDAKVTWNWYDELSPGEMQRLSFLRLFYHQPPYAVLDEATSQISVDAEELMYRTCRELGITTLSVGHRDTIRRYHDMELHFLGDGSWTLGPVASGSIQDIRVDSTTSDV